MNHYSFKALTAVIIIAIAGGLYSCKTTDQVKRGPDGEVVSDDSLRVSELTESGIDLARYRSSLDDVYATQHHDIPEAFLKTYKGDQEVERDPFDGFRIQIISTRNVASADSTARAFRMWADTTLAGYVPEAYVFFKQPYYKVHVGDFHNREKANSFSKFIKRKYPDAWVVHDRINPGRVPADTVNVELVPPKPTADTTDTGESQEK